MGTIAARALGFASQDLEETYDASKAFKNREEKVRIKADMMVGAFTRMILSIEDQDEQAVYAHQLLLNTLKKDIDNDADRQAIYTSFRKKLEKESFRDKTYEQYLENANSDLVGAAGKMFTPGQEAFEEETK